MESVLLIRAEMAESVDPETLQQKEKDEDSSEDEDMKSDDNSEESSENEENDNDREIAELEDRVKANPFHYDSYIALIKLLRQEGELEKLRDARERMSSAFPLTPELWLDWIQDEIKYASDSSKERERICSLFDKAVKDYLSVPLWLEYVQYAIGGMSEPDGMQKIRDVFERALIACGLHVTQGSTIWEAYREFENAVLMGLQPTPGSVSSKEQEKQLEDQMNNITKLFRRQLSVPLFDMESSFGEYMDWCSGEADSNIKAFYEKAKAKLLELEPYENALLKADAPRLSEYESYLEYEMSQKEPVRIQCLFERALTENCLVADLWLKYTKYLERELKIAHVNISVYDRALRNSPWSAQLWVGYLRTLERNSQPHKEIQMCFEKALTAGFSQASDYLELWLAFCDYLRRRINWNEEHSEELELLRTTFDRAVEYIYTYFPEDGDPSCSLLRYWARIEAVHCKNMEKTRDLWAQIMQAGHAHEAQMWLDNFNMERSFGNPKHCRRVLQKAISSTSDWPESVFEAYINYEREEGTLEQYDVAVRKVETQMARVQERREKAAEKEASSAEQKKQQRKDKQAAKKSDKKQQAFQQHSKKPNQTSPVKLQTVPSEQKENNSASNAQGEALFKVPTPPEVNSMSAAQPDKPKSAPPPGYKRKAAPPGYKPSTGPQGGQEPPAKKSRGDEIEDLSEPPGQPSHVDKARPSCTAFISNLDYKVDEKQLMEIFSKVGEVTQVRLVKNFKGKSKGFAYVEFKDELLAREALKLDRQPLDGRPMFVSEFSEGAGVTKPFKFSTGLEKCKLFVRGLPFTCTEEALEKIFKQHGALKSVRLVTYRNGASKGLAYVEYEKEADAAHAVLKTDELVIGEHTISVAISNPPQRKAPSGLLSTTLTPTLGGGKKDFGVRGKAHTQISLVPRTVKPGQSTPVKPTANKPGVQPMDTNTDSKAVQKEEDSKKMSNEDFRKMLLNS